MKQKERVNLLLNLISTIDIFSFLRLPLTLQPDWPGTHRVVQASLKLAKILLLQFPKCCNYKHEPPHLALYCRVLSGLIYREWVHIIVHFRYKNNTLVWRLQSFSLHEKKIISMKKWAGEGDLGSPFVLKEHCWLWCSWRSSFPPCRNAELYMYQKAQKAWTWNAQFPPKKWNLYVGKTYTIRWEDKDIRYYSRA